MRWSYLSVNDGGITCECTVCKRSLPDEEIIDGDIIYFPEESSPEQDEAIRQVWGVDPFSDFVVCKKCLRGHWHAVGGFTADNWLREELAKRGITLTELAE